MPSERFEFTGSHDDALHARVELPDGPIVATCVFAHCFTCSMQTTAARRVTRALTRHGIATLRFDFTGLGGSEGDFANADFSSNVEDVLLAAEALAARYRAPAVLVGHSFGGAAVLAAAHGLPSVKLVCTIGAPADPAHVRHLFDDKLDQIADTGSAPVEIAGRTFTVTKKFLDDISGQPQQDRVAALGRPLLLFHAPGDETVPFAHAEQLQRWAPHDASLITLPPAADHLLTDERDAELVADMICARVRRVLEDAAPDDTAAPDHEAPVVVHDNHRTPYGQDISAGGHPLSADEPRHVGGQDSGPSPYQLLLAALGACTSMTLRMYADRKRWPLEHVDVSLTHKKIHATDCATCDETQGKVDRIDRVVHITGDLDDEQRQRLLEIADKCPVHQTLHRKNEVKTVLGDGPAPGHP